MSEFEKSRECRDEKLIKIVKGLPALWDPCVPLYKKTKTKKRLLWEQVENLMEGVITADDASKRWKYLKDCYIRYKRESSIPRRPKDFRFAEIMCFVEATEESYVFLHLAKFQMQQADIEYFNIGLLHLKFSICILIFSILT
ncbi:hypothetical protein ACS0PU_003999 [Formica fusca]